MSQTKHKILIIEDDAFLLTMYSTKFELEGYEVLTSDEGDRGLKLAQKENPDIILLDVLLPKMNGFEVLKELKKNDKTKDIKVLLLTNLSQRGEVQQGLDLGAIDYLIKAHYMPSEVVERVEKILK
ncbi:response regulator [Candidatus Falkowbacteria bacterium]|nr:response regulator [Candidatus Falkowbacteria bacterium]